MLAIPFSSDVSLMFPLIAEVLIAKGIAPPPQPEANAPRGGSVSPLAQPHQDTQDAYRTPEETAMVRPKLEEGKDEPLLFPNSDVEEDVRKARSLYAKPVIEETVKTNIEISIDAEIALAEAENERIKVRDFRPPLVSI